MHFHFSSYQQHLYYIIFFHENRAHNFIDKETETQGI